MPARRHNAPLQSSVPAPFPVPVESPSPCDTNLSPPYSPSSPNCVTSPNDRLDEESVTSPASPDGSEDESEDDVEEDDQNRSDSGQEDDSSGSGDNPSLPCNSVCPCHSDEDGDASTVTVLDDSQSQHGDSALGTPNTPEGTTWTEMDTEQ